MALGKTAATPLARRQRRADAGEVKLDEITDEGLMITTKEGEKRLLEADTIITALPLSPNTELCEELESVAPEVRCIGDSREPGLVVDAIAAGAAAGRAI